MQYAKTTGLNIKCFAYCETRDSTANVDVKTQNLKKNAIYQGCIPPFISDAMKYYHWTVRANIFFQ